ncbi:hypothetical protein [Pseudoalteromonas luteoviolacea]|uniref:Uncharacterized protein n=1 Tax=Pseudoalteromonas luteoviolacea (strain 2ta16) TaxID=1353533 RepID=V4HT54_PSEL2|nr:hypothetical protein [Pseudoalteromonas luteoviolacea]ESP91114.1 hypothetical protein PL2TA16_01121 [Pseudoalteromonas luteoviolacea 2ta16]KZN41353.1 hypothetical protein N483_15770 [Pseudoalteromonas luteoviolacea NCIMB 1944]
MRNLLVLLLLFSSASFSSEGVFERWTAKGKECFFKFQIPPSVNWDGESELPISIKGINTAFKNWTNANLSSGEEAHVTNYNLASVFSEEATTNYWVYKVGYVVFNNGSPTQNFNRKVVIDLSGKVITPVCGL